jgi:hypothetical protein
MIDWLQEVTSEVHRGEITVDKYLERYTKVMRASLTGELVAQSGCIVRYRPASDFAKSPYRRMIVAIGGRAAPRLSNAVRWIFRGGSMRR